MAVGMVGEEVIKSLVIRFLLAGAGVKLSPESFFII